jgi:hypothetical protein
MELVEVVIFYLKILVKVFLLVFVVFLVIFMVFEGKLALAIVLFMVLIRLILLILSSKCYFILAIGNIKVCLNQQTANLIKFMHFLD